MLERTTQSVRLLAGDKEPVRVASTENLTLSGLQAVDGVTVESGDRVLVKDQTDATTNGIYTASVGTWRRAPDANSSRLFVGGMKVHVREGTLQSASVWSLSSHDPNIGDDDIEYEFYLSTGILEAALNANDSVASRAVIEETAFNGGKTYIAARGYAEADDTQGYILFYRRVDAEPSHPGKVRSADFYNSSGSIDLDDGGWWELVVPVAVPLMFGAKGDGALVTEFDDSEHVGQEVPVLNGGGLLQYTGTDDTAALEAMWDYIIATGCEFDFVSGRKYIIDGTNIAFPDGVPINGSCDGVEFIITRDQRGSIGPGIFAFSNCTPLNFRGTRKVWGNKGKAESASANFYGSTFLYVGNANVGGDIGHTDAVGIAMGWNITHADIALCLDADHPTYVGVGGTGWAVDDEFEIEADTPQVGLSKARGRVVAETGGVVTEWEIIDEGFYPPGPVLLGYPPALQKEQDGIAVTPVDGATGTGLLVYFYQKIAEPHKETRDLKVSGRSLFVCRGGTINRGGRNIDASIEVNYAFRDMVVTGCTNTRLSLRHRHIAEAALTVAPGNGFPTQLRILDFDRARTTDPDWTGVNTDAYITMQYATGRLDLKIDNMRLDLTGLHGGGITVTRETNPSILSPNYTDGTYGRRHDVSIEIDNVYMKGYSKQPNGLFGAASFGFNMNVDWRKDCFRRFIIHNCVNEGIGAIDVNPRAFETFAGRTTPGKIYFGAGVQSEGAIVVSNPASLDAHLDTTADVSAHPRATFPNRYGAWLQTFPDSSTFNWPQTINDGVEPQRSVSISSTTRLLTVWLGKLVWVDRSGSDLAAVLPRASAVPEGSIQHVGVLGGPPHRAYIFGNDRTVTLSIASPGVATLVGHGYAAGDPIIFSTTGALPTGTATNLIHFVLATDLTADTFKYATTPGGSAVNNTGTQSGTHSVASRLDTGLFEKEIFTYRVQGGQWLLTSRDTPQGARDLCWPVYVGDALTPASGFDGVLVNVYNSGGSTMLRPADPSLSRPANGFVIGSYTVGQYAVLHTTGWLRIGFAPPGPAYLSTGNAISTSPHGTLNQYVGVIVTDFRNPANSTAQLMVDLTSGAFGTAAFANTGASGHTLPFLDVAATVSANWQFPNGSAANPSVTVGNATKGIYHVDTHVLGLSAQGTHVLSAHLSGVIIGHTAALTLGGGGGRLQVVGSSAGNASMHFARFSNGAGGPSFSMFHERNDTIGGLGALTTNDQIGTFNFFAGNGTDQTQAAYVRGYARGDFSSAGTRDADIVIATISAGTLAERFMFKASGTFTDGSGNVLISAAGKITSRAALGCATYTVAALPAGVTGDVAYASNLRVFNGAGTQEGAAAGTGGHVTYNGSAWKIAGTNITAVA